MPLELYERNGWWWFKGRIDRLPTGKYYRQSSGVPSSAPERDAQAAVFQFEGREIKRDLVGDEKALTFADAVLLYPANPMEATDLQKILPHIEDRAVTTITPQEVRNLGATLYPTGSTDSWQRHVVTPIRAVINNAHDLGKCPPIRVKAYSKAERLKQDRVRGKQSRVEKVPGSWEWLLAFRTKANRYQAAMAHFMFVTGARISQAAAILPDDLDLQNARVWMPEAKGTEAQWVDIPMDLVVELANLRPRRPRQGPHGKTRMKEARVFGYASKNGVYKAWKTACKNAGISEIMPHAAGRHGFATEMLVRQKLDARTVAKAGRWSDMALMQKTYMHEEDTSDKVQAALRTGRVQATKAASAKARKAKAKSA
ncbi:site-specific integrase [Mesorhizobium sp. M8A.F.Ca.ET.165.01.1.1]|uniref:tyrosine-type recombinase/integrase n=1 Tax=Mesorhizobium sp. M8A.F.Ca.ET.165.01.1.1 TaxID=2563960 RepID=UPI0010938353|nr:site-specific integrase [Mesorhizobium sp. M8A.F.Ca.ET.165.01.1.1]TGT36188.1 site-specific integrase [Mesorhizobium sp. M8A.F.Ca.ET.165.01.1.1]